MDDNLKEEIVKLYQRGLSIMKVANKLNVPRHRVYSTLKERGVEMHPPYKVTKSDPNLEKDIVDLARFDMLGARNIGRLCGVSEYRVRKVLEKHGISMRRGAVVRNRTKSKYKEIADFALRYPDVPYREIADKWGVSFQTVIRATRVFGVRRRKGPKPKDNSAQGKV